MPANSAPGSSRTSFSASSAQRLDLPSCRDKFAIALHAAIASSSSTIRLSFAPSSPCRWRPTVSAVLWRPSIHARCSQQQFRVKDSNLRHALQRRRSYRWTNPDQVRRAGGCRTLVTRLKAKCSTVELRPQNGDRACGFSMELLRHHVPFVGALGIEPRRCRARVIYSHARGHAGLRTRKREEPPRGFPRAAPDRFGCFSRVYESGAFPSYVVGCGSRLIPTTVPWPAKLAGQCQSRRAHTCPMTPWRLVTLVDAVAIDMRCSTRGRLARCARTCQPAR